jgi:hypothetical protein
VEADGVVDVEREGGGLEAGADVAAAGAGATALRAKRPAAALATDGAQPPPSKKPAPGEAIELDE